MAFGMFSRIFAVTIRIYVEAQKLHSIECTDRVLRSTTNYATCAEMDHRLFTSNEFTVPLTAPTTAKHRCVASRAATRAPGGLAATRTARSEVYGPTWQSLRLSTAESGSFLRILEKVSRIASHYELLLLLQGDIQRFIPHRIFISAWGDYRSSEVRFDVISSMPGVRTGELSNACVQSLAKSFFARWIGNGRRPVVLDKAAFESNTHCSPEDCALDAAITRIRSALVHGIHNARDNNDSLYVAFNPEAITNGYSNERFCALADWLISEIDVAFQRVSPLPLMPPTCANSAESTPRSLSRREQEVMKWVGEGRTNPEIAEILCVSRLTVKNHVQSIFRKLGARNRTDAVIKYPRICIAR